MDDLIRKLSEIRSEYNCFDKDEESYYHALSEAIRILSRRADGDTISRQDAIDAAKRVLGDHEITRTLQTALYILPSAQPEIIRCKYCKHSREWYKDKRRCFLWHEEGIDVFDDGYCNYAKRRMRGKQDD